MAELGYFLSSEENGPRRLVQYARLGEQAGLADILISDHYHAWVERQGESPFVWSVIGAIAASTGTGFGRSRHGKEQSGRCSDKEAVVDDNDRVLILSADAGG